MSFRIRNLNTWIIIHKCKELGITSRLVVPEKEDFLELEKEGKKIIINRAISPFLKHIPGAITEDKITCNYLLQENNFPIPPFIFSNSIGKSELDFLSNNAPIIVKPHDTNKGVKIFMDINTSAELERALSSIKTISDKAILQKQAEGKDYRVLIIKDEVVGVLWNEWPYVIGDGKQTIEELVNIENKKRIECKVDVYGKLTEMLVEIPTEYLNQYLLKKGYHLDSIPPLNKKIYLSQCGNGWSGAIPHDVTDQMHSSLKEKTIEIAKFLDIDVAGIDIRCSDITKPFDETDLYLIEVNTRPSLIDHEIPMTGKARNVTEKYIKYLFYEKEQ